MMNDYAIYRCPEPNCHSTLSVRQDGVLCTAGHAFSFAPGTSIPIFARQPLGTNEYASGESPEKHDNALRWLLRTFGTDEPTLRRRLVDRLSIGPGARVLVTGAGAGNDLPFIAERLAHDGEITAQDIAAEMLLEGVKRHAKNMAAQGIRVRFFVGDATNLPLSDGAFDAAYHFGGINLFPDVSRGIAEMDRVVKVGGRVVVGDEGVAPWLRETELGRMLVNNNALYGYEAPLYAVPETARSPRLTWELCNTFWIIDFEVSRSPLPIDLDVPHVGKRGGTIRTRFEGQLEGIAPALRDRVYQEAARKGVSRVEFLESALRKAVEAKEDPP